ncbi:MAG: HAD family phosphatase [Ignavibacteria bacterium]|nr:HAD family phosphatase [Ignavibacteria bacterium]
MIRAIVFDLDGTLVRTEDLKALSYARAAMELRPEDLTEAVVIEAFKDVVGLSRQEVSEALIQRFKLEEAVRKRIPKQDATAVRGAFADMRMQIYNRMLADPQILDSYKCPNNVGCLHRAREENLRTGLATMSQQNEAKRVLEILKIEDKFDFIATRETVIRGKPDPEIYLLVAEKLGVQPHECLVIEDSPTGIKAALTAGMPCIAVTSDFTRKVVHASGLLDKRWIVDDTTMLTSRAMEVVGESKKG